MYIHKPIRFNPIEPLRIPLLCKLSKDNMILYKKDHFWGNYRDFIDTSPCDN